MIFTCFRGEADLFAVAANDEVLDLIEKDFVRFCIVGRTDVRQGQFCNENSKDSQRVLLQVEDFEDVVEV